MVCMLAVSAAAQQPPQVSAFVLDVEVAPQGVSIPPITGLGAATATLSIACAAGGAPPVDPVSVRAEVTADEPWATVTVAPAEALVEIPPEACVQGIPVVTRFNITTSLAETAPAFATVSLQITATAAGAEPVSAAWTETAGIFFNHQARFEKSIWKAAPGTEVHVPLTVENGGNAAISVQSSIGNGTSSGFEVRLPEPFVVDAFGGRSTVKVEVKVPEGGVYENRQDQLVLDLAFEAAAQPAFDAEPGAQVTAVIQTQGSSLGASSASVVLVLAGLAALGVLVGPRRRR